ncbi:cation:proton antiporter [Timonella sp. A28]|uniref:cation:proton antiporter n=1 Tax=Timonella sp. A28 TaxID=3442640 RepID=UPI003EB811EE
MELQDLLVTNLQSAWWVVAVAAVAPILALVTRRHVPDVVWLLALGVVIGPHGYDVAHHTEAIEFLRELGMGFLFLLAGFELNTSDLRARQGKQAAVTWLICAALGVGAGLLLSSGELKTAIVLGIASTSTALGTLLPILKDSGVKGSPLGKAAMIHGAYGELLPIIAMSLLLSAHGTGVSALILVLFAVLAVLIVLVPVRVFRRIPMLGRALVGAANTTMQTTLRFAVLALISLMLLTAVLELDVALGAFSAGLLLNSLYKAVAPELGVEVAHKVEIVGFSFLIPVFFVTSGMNIDVMAVIREWPTLLGFVVMIAVVRGVVVFVREKFAATHSGLTHDRERMALGLYAATGLPIIVAVTQIAQSSGIIEDTTASVLVTAGAVTVLLFPLLAALLIRSQKHTVEVQ